MKVNVSRKVVILTSGFILFALVLGFNGLLNSPEAEGIVIIVPDRYILKIGERKIQLESWSWGATQSGTAGAGASGRPQAKDFQFTSRVGVHSPELMKALANGTNLGEVTLMVVNGNTNETYFQIKLENAMVSSYQVGGSGGERPMESVSLNFTKIEMKFMEGQDESSSSWDIKKGKVL